MNKYACKYTIDVNPPTVPPLHIHVHPCMHTCTNTLHSTHKNNGSISSKSVALNK